MRELALFAGIGGGILGGKLLGWRTVCAVEIDPYCQRVLMQRQDDGILEPFPIWDDVRTFDGAPWRGCVDVVSAGFPCQPFSVAGKQLAEEDERNCWPDTIRIIREVRPAVVFLENVPGLLTARRVGCSCGGVNIPGPWLHCHACRRPLGDRTAVTFRYFDTLLGSLAESGFDAEWGLLSASQVGAPHRRQRLWIVAYSHSNAVRLWGERGAAAWRKRGEAPTEPGATLDDPERHRPQREQPAGPAQGTVAGPASRPWPPLPGDREAWGRVPAHLEPAICRVADGVPNRVVRLRALGNAQVPRVAATAWGLLT